jgi:uncharacterized pyridoxal phosphate-containing UPF0001 family protein
MSTSHFQNYRSTLKTIPSSVQLLDVTKLQPVSALAEIVGGVTREPVGERRAIILFGEVDVQELEEKSGTIEAAVSAELVGEDDEVVVAEYGFAFIGELQSDAVERLLRLPRLQEIHSLASVEQVTKLLSLLASGNDAVACTLPLAVYLQVKSSEDESATPGFAPLVKEDMSSPLLVAARALADADPTLVHFAGLMTTAKLGDADPLEDEETPLSDFDLLALQRSQLEQLLGREPSSLGLSMGDNNDYQQAMDAGATTVHRRSAARLLAGRIYKKYLQKKDAWPRRARPVVLEPIDHTT